MSNTPNPKVSAMLGFLSNLDLSMPAVGVAVLALKWEELLVPAAVLVGGAVSVALVNAGYGAVLSYQEQTETNELEEMYALPSSDDDDGDEEKAL